MPTNQNAIDLITRTLAVMAVACVLTVCVLAFMGKQIPPELNTIASGLVGSCASMLVKTSPTDTTQKVKVVNDPGNKGEEIPVTTEHE